MHVRMRMCVCMCLYVCVFVCVCAVRVRVRWLETPRVAYCRHNAWRMGRRARASHPPKPMPYRVRKCQRQRQIETLQLCTLSHTSILTLACTHSNGILCSTWRALAARTSFAFVGAERERGGQRWGREGEERGRERGRKRGRENERERGREGEGGGRWWLLALAKFWGTLIHMTRIC